MSVWLISRKSGSFCTRVRRWDPAPSPTNSQATFTMVWEAYDGVLLA